MMREKKFKIKFHQAYFVAYVIETCDIMASRNPPGAQKTSKIEPKTHQTYIH
jgi:hypothetical protein